MTKFLPSTRLLIVLACVGYSLGVARARAADCSACDKRLAEVREREAAIQKYSELLGKNRDYLARLTPTEGKAIKVNSNIMTILLKIDGVKKEVVTLKQELEKEGCEKCQKPGQ